MKRFDDQTLGGHPHLAVLFQDKIGGFVVATPLLRGLKEKYPTAILDYFGGERTEELEAACPYIDARYSLFGPSDAVREVGEFIRQREIQAGPYDLAINLDFNPLSAVVTAALAPRYVVGRCFRPDGRGELPLGDSRFDEILRPTTYWASDDFVPRFADTVTSNFIGEIFCRLARVETDFQRTEVSSQEPPFAIPDVLIATGGTRPAKVWPASAWKRLLTLCDAAELSVGLLGAAPEVQKLAYHSAELEAELLASTRLVDLRGRLTLPEVAGALQRARACVTIDGGLCTSRRRSKLRRSPSLEPVRGTSGRRAFRGSIWSCPPKPARCVETITTRTMSACATDTSVCSVSDRTRSSKRYGKCWQSSQSPFRGRPGRMAPEVPPG